MLLLIFQVREFVFQRQLEHDHHERDFSDTSISMNIPNYQEASIRNI